MAARVTSLKTQIEESKDRISQFKSVPPSIPLAKEKIREVQTEIIAIEQEFPELCL